MPSWRCNKLRLDGAASSSLQTVMLDLLSGLAQRHIHLHLLLAPVDGEFHSIAGAVGVHHLCQILLVLNVFSVNCHDLVAAQHDGSIAKVRALIATPQAGALGRTSGRDLDDEQSKI